MHPKIAHLTPVPMLRKVLTEKETFHLTLTNLVLNDDVYLEFYQKRIAQGDYVVMDTPAFETSEPTSIGAVETAAARLNPSEVVLPDDVGSGSNTVLLAKRTKEKLALASYSGKTMAVPHGRDIREYLTCAIELVEEIGVDVLGVVEEIPELFGHSRLEVVQKIHNRLPEAQFHLLGVDEELLDFWVPDHLPVRSIDTAKFVVYGLNGIRLDPEKKPPTYPGRKTVGGRAGYFYHNINDKETIETIRHNIEVFS